MDTASVGPGIERGSSAGRQGESCLDVRAEFRRSSCFGGVELVRAVVRSGRFASHTHDEWTVGLLDSGSCGFECGREWWVWRAGMVLVIPPGVAHDGGASGGGVSYRVMHVPAGAMALACNPSLPRAGVLDDRALFDRLGSLHDALMKSGDGSELDGDMSRALSAMPRGSGPVGDGDAVREARRVRLVRDYLAAHLGESASLDALSDLAGVSPFYLQRTFKKATRMSPREYLMDLRVRRARALLREGFSPRRVAEEVGFFDQSHFTRAFRRLTGLTPGQFAAGDGRASGR